MINGFNLTNTYTHNLKMPVSTLEFLCCQYLFRNIVFLLERKKSSIGRWFVDLWEFIEKMNVEALRHHFNSAPLSSNHYDAILKLSSERLYEARHRDFLLCFLAIFLSDKTKSIEIPSFLKSDQSTRLTFLR